MNTLFTNNLQIREIFHIEFLRAFTKMVRPAFHTLKGGVNLRLFFGSFRYSEDMDLDINTISISALRDAVVKIILSPTFRDVLQPFGIERIIPPNMSVAKQTATTQRFKIHLITEGGEDLFTKIEFSRRQTKGNAVVEPVPDKVLRRYKMPPFIASHYDASTAVTQKIMALVGRSSVQARDVFDLHVLSSQIADDNRGWKAIDTTTAKIACENIFSISFHQFRDAVLNYLSEDDKTMYDSADVWDEIKLKVSDHICPSR